MKRSIINNNILHSIISYKSLFLILSIFFIYIYVSILKNFYKAEQDDILNIKLLQLDICGWNLLHVVFYFLICYIFDIKTLIGYIFIFSTGIVWFFLEKSLFFKYNKDFIENNNNKNYVYSSISYPRKDDIIFNFLGILLYFLSQKIN